MNPYPAGSPHARAWNHVAERMRADGEVVDREIHQRNFEEFEARLAELRPTMDCSKDPVITKPEAAPGTSIPRLLEAVAAGMGVPTTGEGFMGEHDFDQTLLDSFLIQADTARFLRTRKAEEAKAAAKAAADAEAKAKADALVEERDLRAALVAWKAERKQEPPK